MANHLDVTDLMAKNAKLKEALINARVSLIAFGGDPRKIYEESNGQFGDMIQVCLLETIDEALE